jgi:uncharacterized membrane protein
MSSEYLPILIAIIIWFGFFLIIRIAVNKVFTSEFRVRSNGENFYTNLHNELETFYHVSTLGSKIILKTTKINDMITDGVLEVEFKNKDDPQKIIIRYRRKIKIVGYLLILLGISLCYIGVLLPYIQIQETKKTGIAEMDRIKSLIKSINH